ncbi:MAG TPA: LamG-like jellyroll fold domain-containing protein, partial [Nocardioides sp.]|nr:LamG-like jellyroll fold domain-containing protein [Nocardioides sp.]
APGTATLSIGNLTGELSAGTDLSSQNPFGTYVGTFTATARRMPLSITAGSSGAGLVVDDLVVVGTSSGSSDVPVQYQFEEGAGQTAANTGTDGTVGAATLTGNAGWSTDGISGKALDLPGGPNSNAVDLPDNLLQNEASFTTSLWVRPDTKGNWINLFHIGDGLEGAGSFFQIQMQTDAAPGGTGLAATFKKKGSALQERIYATPTKDVVAGQWNHVAFTRQGATGSLYLNGVKIATRSDLTLTMTDVGPTTNNWLGRNGYPDPSFDGRMDDVRVYTSALSDEDIAGMYADGSALATTTTVSVSPASPSPFDTPITVSATVKDAANANPAGVAELWIDGAREGSAVTVTNGAVSFPPVTLLPKAHQVEVRFIADAGWRDSAQTVTHTVSRPPVGAGVPVHYKFDEGTGTTSVNSGSDPAIGNAVLQGNAGWVASAKYGAGVNLPGAGHVNLPNDITFGMTTEATVSTWIRPTNLPNWTTHVQIGKDTSEFLLLQSETENGSRGFAATLRKNNGEQYRIQLPGTADLPLNQWTHVVVTLGPSPSGGGTTGKIYFNGVLQNGGTRDNIPVSIGDIGDGGTTANFIGNGSWNDPRPTEQQDDFRLYGYELDAAEVTALYNGTTNAAPVGASDAYGAVEDEPLVVAAPGVLANDTDADGNALTATGVTQPANGTVSLAANGGFTYTPAAGFSGTDTFSYRASDGTASSAATTVTITVEESEQPPANTAPVAATDAYDAVGGEPLVIPAPGVLTNDTDAEGNVLTTTDVVQPANGEVSVAADGSFTYVSDAGFNGKDVFSYRADDGEKTSAPAQVTVTVKSPTVTAVAGVAVPIGYGTTGTVSVVVSPDTAGGQAELRKGTQLLAVATVAEGRGTLVLPAKSLLPGFHDLTVRYLGDADHAPATSTVRVQVDKAVPTMEVTAAKAAGGKATVTVALTAPNAVLVEGQVRIEIDGGATMTATVADGTAVFALPKAPKGGQLTLRASYLGSDLVQQATARVTVRVR